MLANPVWKGVVGTVPDLLAAPYFQFIAATVAKPTEIIPMANDATLAQLQGLAAGFNSAIILPWQLYLLCMVE